MVRQAFHILACVQLFEELCRSVSQKLLPVCECNCGLGKGVVRWWLRSANWILDQEGGNDRDNIPAGGSQSSCTSAGRTFLCDHEEQDKKKCRRQ
jgi:hypothetical protein